MPATVMSTAEASGKIVGKIVDDLMATVPGAYVATIRYDNDGTPTTTTIEKDTYSKLKKRGIVYYVSCDAEMVESGRHVTSRW